jgi:hypothetical protein
MRKCLVALSGIMLFLSLDAQAIEVGSITNTRFESDWTLDGSEMTTTRAKLLAAANFGPAGTVTEAIHIIDVAGPIDYTLLSQFDIFFIGYLPDGSANAFSADELQAFQDWVNAGGTMIITCDEANYDAVCAAFGPTPGASVTPPVNPTNEGMAHPLFDGPFGMPAELQMWGTQTAFDDAAGFTVLGQDQDSNPVVLESVIGDGRVIVFTDVDIISNNTLSAGTGIANDNDKFLGNLVAYLADEAVETFQINAGLNGNWWYGPGRSGEGAQLEVSDGGGGAVTLVATVYSYDNSGQQIFLIAVGNADGNSADVDVFITEGGLWGQDFDPGLVNESQWGTGTFTSGNCGNVHMQLKPNVAHQIAGFTDLEYDLIRLTVPLAPCPVANPI